MFLLDANVLIRANADFYPLDRIPQFWKWLEERGRAGAIKIPKEINQEILRVKTDPVAIWLSKPDIKKSLLLEEEANPELVQRVINEGYEGRVSELDERQVGKVGRDPFLVAYALAENTGTPPLLQAHEFPEINRVVVTREVSQPSKRYGNRKLPDVCNDLKVQWTNDYELYRVLNFNLSHLD